MLNNPWLKISASDYVNHMSSSEVMQYQMINDCFKSVIGKYKPKKLFVPGCTIGNGFEHINWNVIEKVTALDINDSYLKILQENFGKYQSLEIINKDVVRFQTEEKYDLIFTALLFEYVDISKTLSKMKNLMTADSILYVILQLPSKKVSMISQTKYKSLEQLSSLMKLVDIEQFKTIAKKLQLEIKAETTIRLKSGKSFLGLELTEI